jgi:hypothetical protein
MADTEDTNIATASLDELMPTIGSSGVKRSGGVIYEEILTKLQGVKGVRYFREMIDNCSAVGAARHLIHLFVRQAEWRAEPAPGEEDEEAKKAEADYIEEVLDDMDESIEDTMTEILSGIDYGWSYLEIMFKLRKGPDETNPALRSDHTDGKWGARSISLRGQETLDRWELDEEDGTILGMWQRDNSVNKGPVLIPSYKAVHFRTESTKNNPEGRSLYRPAAIDWHFLKRIQEIEAIGIERDMTGVIDMQVPMELLATNAKAGAITLRSTLETQLGQLKRDEREYIIRPCELDEEGKPTGFKLQLLHSGGRRQIDTTEVKSYYQAAILRVVLAHFLQFGQAPHGTFSAASSATNLFGTALGAILDMIAATLTKQFVHRLMVLNGTPREWWPTMVHGDVETPPLVEISQYLTALASAGMDLTAPSLQRRLLEIGDLPVEAVDEMETADAVMSDAIGKSKHGCGC